jgi:hypothetical protein
MNSTTNQDSTAATAVIPISVLMGKCGVHTIENHPPTKSSADRHRPHQG